MSDATESTVPLSQSVAPMRREPTRFLRDAYAMWTAPTPNALYIAHSIPSRRNSADGVTLKEIIKDHRKQAETDGGHPLLISEITEALFVAIAIGLVKATPGEAE